MDSKPQTALFSWSMPLPVALIAGLITSLILIINSRNYDELKKRNEVESERGILIKNEIQTLESKIELLKPEAASLKTSVVFLNEQKGAANETINQARALTVKLEGLRTDESNLKQRIQDQEKSYQEVVGKITMAQRNLADSETRISESRVELNTVQAKQNDSADRVRTLTQSILEREGAFISKNSELAAKTTEIAGKNTEIAARSATLDGILAESKIGARRLADSKSELDGLTKEIGQMNKERADLIQHARIRSEMSDLAAKVDGLKQDRRSLEGQIEDRKQEKLRLEIELAELQRAKNALLIKPAPTTNEQNETTPSK